MVIFEEEKSLASINVDKTIALCNPIRLIENKDEEFINSLNSLKSCSNKKLVEALEKVSAQKHPDLMYGSAILASTVMNLNDDVFVPEEMWNAKDTPVNTPYNDQHVDCDIIGHIIAAKPINKEGNTITAAEDYFDIAVDFVVYKTIFPELAIEIAEGAAKDTKFVSMECIFSGFDYALVQANSFKIIKREKNTAFLTKYLKAYGGNGLYNDYRIGRVLRNFRFVGMGNVDVPANPDSRYTKIESLEFAQNDILEKQVLIIAKGTIMKVENMEQAVATIEQLTKRVEELEAEKSTATNVTSELTEKLSTAEAKIATAEQVITDIKAELTQVKTDLKAKSDELEQIHKTAKANDRINQLKNIGVNLDPEKDKAKYEDMLNWSDAQFNSFVDFAKSIQKDPTDVNQAQQNAEEQLDNAQADNQNDVTNDAGDVETDLEKIQKVAAKLSDALRSKKIKKVQK